MKTYMYDFSKNKDYTQTVDELYKKRFIHIDINMRHAWKKNTFYRRGDVVFDHIETKKFFILYFEGTSSTVDTIYDDELEWVEYNAMTTSTMTNFNEILLQGDIKKYQTDSKYYDIYNVPTNIKIEQIAYEYYGDINYWDTILVLNNMKTYLDLPKSNDIIISKTLEKLKKWGKLFKYTDEDFKYLDNYLNNVKIDRRTNESKGTWGIYKDIRTTFTDKDSTGVFYLNKGDLIKVLDYKGRKNVLFYYKNQQPKITEITFGVMDSETPSNPVFPMEVNDVISLNINGVNLIHNVLSGSSQNLQGNFDSVLEHYESMLISASIYGIQYSFDYTFDHEKITLKNNVNILNDYSVKLNNTSYRQIPPTTGIQGKTSDVMKINTVKTITVEEAVDENYLVEVDDNFILIDYNNTEELERYELLLSTYRKYFDEMNEENNKYQFLKVLKPEYLNEFKEAFISNQKTEGE